MTKIQTPRERRASAAVARAGDGLEAVEAARMVLPDPRRRQGVRHALRSVVLTALMAMVCGCDDAEAMEDWGEHHEDWLRQLLDLPRGVPFQEKTCRLGVASKRKRANRSRDYLMAVITGPEAATDEKSIALNSRSLH